MTMRRQSSRFHVMFLVLFAFLLAGCGGKATPTPLPIRLPTPTAVDIPTVVWTPRAARTRPTPTPTPTATVGSSETPTPVSSSAQVVYGWVKPLKARLRAAPSLDADVISLLPAGTSLQLLGRTADGRWYRVRALLLPSGDVEGWMASEVVVTFADPNDIPVVEANPKG